jgi:hypothetical protein
MEIVRRFGETPVLPDVKADVSIDQLRQAFQTRPYDFEVGYQLYREQIRNERIDDALMTVRHFAEMANCPKYFHFLEAEAWVKKGNWNGPGKHGENGSPTESSECFALPCATHIYSVASAAWAAARRAMGTRNGLQLT